jgi:hypothetical protein
MRTAFTIYLALVWLLVPYPFDLLVFALSVFGWATNHGLAMERMPAPLIDSGNRSDGGLVYVQRRQEMGAAQ